MNAPAAAATNHRTPPGARRRVPWDSPPFPTSEYQGYPLIGVPPSATEDPMQKALLLGPFGDEIRDSRIEFHGWVTVVGQLEQRPQFESADGLLDRAQLVPARPGHRQVRARDRLGSDRSHRLGIPFGGPVRHRLPLHDGRRRVQPATFISQQPVWVRSGRVLRRIVHPQIFSRGLSIRLGRWIACPDIEAQYAPDNYLASHSLLFTYDTYTQTGAMFSFQINQRNMIQGAIQSGTDMAPWYVGAVPTGFFGWRWVSESNNDAFYTCLNNINNAKFRYFMADGQKAGHDNFNYIVSTWEHRFSQKVHTKTEAYYMWQFDAVVGGTPSLGPPMSFGGGGGLGKFLPGNSPAYGVLNYTMFQLSKRDYFTVRNEWWDDHARRAVGLRDQLLQPHHRDQPSVQRPGHDPSRDRLLSFLQCAGVQSRQEQ